MRPGDRQPDQLRSQWSSFLIALLCYLDTARLLPFHSAAASGDRSGGNVYAAEASITSRVCLFFLLYLAICFPSWPRGWDDGWWALLAVPRLYFVLLLLLLSYLALAHHRSNGRRQRIQRWAWAGALCMALTIQVVVTLRHQRGAYDYDSRIPMSSDTSFSRARDSRQPCGLR